MGKREVGSLSIFDLAVYFTISDLITACIIDQNIPIYIGILSVAILCFLQKVIAFITMKNKKIRDFIDGKKAIIINNGEIDFEEMKRQKYTFDDLYSQIREKGLDSISLIRWAILENSGKLSVITYKDSISDFPEPIISDGVINIENVKKSGLSEKYVLSQIEKQNIKNIKDISLCIYVDGKLTFFFKRPKTFK
ncbi:MAG: DUF421 domain-containing protein [Bacilli bacterium]|nr:DUF421 domain-containing protein [Bacilli bacterium]